MKKVKNKSFQLRQNERLAKRERKQKTNAKMMHKMGGYKSVGWLERCKAVAKRILRKQNKGLTKS